MKLSSKAANPFGAFSPDPQAPSPRALAQHPLPFPSDQTCSGLDQVGPLFLELLERKLIEELIRDRKGKGTEKEKREKEKEKEKEEEKERKRKREKGRDWPFWLLKVFLPEASLISPYLGHARILSLSLSLCVTRTYAQTPEKSLLLNPPFGRPFYSRADGPKVIGWDGKNRARLQGRDEPEGTHPEVTCWLGTPLPQLGQAPTRHALITPVPLGGSQ